MNNKPFDIPKRTVLEAWKQVKRNRGSYGIDRVSIQAFEEGLSRNLYKIWNRLSSGTYFPPPVRRVEIPKPDGRTRVLGVPTVSDRVAQATICLHFQPLVEPIFHEDSYGYRPGKSSHQALDIVRQRCWKFGYVVEFDIVGLFDNLPHDLLMKAVHKHCSCPWINLYIERWLKAEREDESGKMISGSKGVPQGSIIGPVLSNLFMHYAFDAWMTRQFPHFPFCRYADDALAHTRTLGEAENLMREITARFEELGLKVHPDKSGVVDCSARKKSSPGIERKCDFLGFQFRRRKAHSKRHGSTFTSFNPGPSPKAMKRIRKEIRESWRLKSRLHMSLADIAREYSSVIRGWFQYYFRFHRKEMQYLAKYIDQQLLKWGQRKFKSLRYRTLRAKAWLKRVYQQQPKLFPHWEHYAVT
jgi:RNA-directed DNA polymerase